MDKEALERMADVAEINPLLAGAVLEELYKLGYRKLPGKPPIISTLDLMPHVIDAQIMGMDSNDGMLDALRLVAQAQRDSDIKWYGGKE